MDTEDENKKENKETTRETARERMGGESQRPEHEEGRGGVTSLLAYLEAHGFSRRSILGVVVVFVFFAVVGLGLFSLAGPSQKGVAVLGPPDVPGRAKPSDPGGLKVDPSLAPDNDDGTAHPVQAPEQPNLEGLEEHYGLVGAPQDKGKKPAQSAQPFSLSTSAPNLVKHQENVVHLGRPEEQVRARQLEQKQGPDIQVQLSAERNDEDAHRNWVRLQKNYPSLMAQKTVHITRGQLSGATIYRLRLSGFASRKQAVHFCQEMHTKQLSCFVAH